MNTRTSADKPSKTKQSERSLSSQHNSAASAAASVQRSILDLQRTRGNGAAQRLYETGQLCFPRSHMPPTKGPKCTGAFQRKGEVCGLQKAGAAQAKREYGAEYDDQAVRLQKAMKGWGTNEEQIFTVLEQVRTRPNGIQFLKAAYRERSHADLVEDLRGELSGSELDFALALMGEAVEREEVLTRQRTDKGDEYDAAADRLIVAMKGLGTDEEAIYATLAPFVVAFGSILKLKEAYKRKTGRSSLDALEEDIKDEMSGDELEHALKMLSGPKKPVEGMPARILDEAERNAAPGGACTVVTMRRYVRAFLDHYYLNGALHDTAQLAASKPGSKEHKTAEDNLRTALTNLLGASLAELCIAGGPAGETDIANILKHPSVLSSERGRKMHWLWQVSGSWPGKEKKYGATESLVTSGKYVVETGKPINTIAEMFNVTPEALKQGNRDKLKPTPESPNPWFNAGETIDIPSEQAPLGQKVAHPMTHAVNIKSILWNEILSPGALIQTWRTVQDAEIPGCASPANALSGACGHSFLFAEYVYADTDAPPGVAPKTWPLFGASGQPITTGGEIDPARKELKNMSNLHLVGLRLIDQAGYHFLPKDQARITSAVLPNNVARVKWLAQSEVWYAVNLA